QCSASPITGSAAMGMIPRKAVGWRTARARASPPPMETPATDTDPASRSRIAAAAESARSSTEKGSCGTSTDACTGNVMRLDRWTGSMGTTCSQMSGQVLRECASTTSGAPCGPCGGVRPIVTWSVIRLLVGGEVGGETHIVVRVEKFRHVHPGGPEPWVGGEDPREVLPARARDEFLHRGGADDGGEREGEALGEQRATGGAEVTGEGRGVDAQVVDEPAREGGGSDGEPEQVPQGGPLGVPRAVGAFIDRERGGRLEGRGEVGGTQRGRADEDRSR